MFHDTGFALRERRGFEALDAGLLLYRRNFLKIQLAWLPFFVPLAAVSFFLPYHLLWIPPVAIWWLRPFWERIILRQTAHIFFGSEGRARWKGLFRGFFSDLTWRRFSPWRLYAQPVRALEGIKGKRLRNRISFLHAEFRGVAAALEITMFILEIAILGGMSTFVVNMVNFLPQGLGFELSWQTEGLVEALICGWLFVGIFTIPAAVCMGFSLYINRRVILEGWDLEIAFSQIAAAKNRRKGSSPVAVLLVLLLLSAAAPAARADESPETVEIEAPIESLEEILADSDFGESVTRTAWRWKKSDESNPSQLFNRSLKPGSDTLAAMLRILVISIAALALGMILWVNRDSIRALLRKGRPGGEAGGGADDSINLMPSGKEPPLPTLADARQMFNTGNHRAAWSILYRRQVANLRIELPHPPGSEATEGEWLQRLSAGNEARVLISNWRQIAYAHANPGESAFIKALEHLSDISEKEVQ